MFIIALVNIMKPIKIMNRGVCSSLGGVIPGIVNEYSRMKKSRHDMTLVRVSDTPSYICGYYE